MFSIHFFFTNYFLWKHRIISLNGEVWTHKTSSTPPPLFIEVPVPSQESERSCFCVLGVSMLPLSMVLLLDFGTVSSVAFLGGFHFIIENFVHTTDSSVVCLNVWRRIYPHYFQMKNRKQLFCILKTKYFKARLLFKPWNLFSIWILCKVMGMISKGSTAII